MTIILLCLVAMGFVSIVIEDVVHINKAKTTLFFGSLVWMLYFILPISHHSAAERISLLNENLLDVATLWLFLMAAMTFVAYLSAKGIIEALVSRLMPTQVSERKLMYLTGLFGFVFSSFADNITATLVCISFLMSLRLDADRLMRYLVLIIFSVNAGGAALITGDVTTLMIFLAGKVSIPNLMLISVPAFAAVMVLAFVLSRPLKEQLSFSKTVTRLSRGDKLVTGLFMLTILGTLLLNVSFGIPPVLCFLFGLSMMFLVVQFLNRDEEVLEYVRHIEFDTLLFFLGVLLLVGMLKELQVLDYFPMLYQIVPVWLANFLMGMVSSLLDNVPLTAALLKSGIEMGLADWLTLTYSVGVGGSLLVIGSAAGVVAMSKIEILTFGRYLKFSGHLLVAYAIGFAAVTGMGWLITHA